MFQHRYTILNTLSQEEEVEEEQQQEQVFTNEELIYIRRALHTFLHEHNISTIKNPPKAEIERERRMLLLSSKISRMLQMKEAA
jgi:hypothetical protein